MKVEFYRHNIGREDVEKMQEVLGSIFLTTGPVTAEFEKKFSTYTALQEVVAVNSCTAALHLSMLALGIGEGDEVITTAMTFIATATSVIHTGAAPVLVDCEKDSALIDPEQVERAITKRTKAILPVHLYGAMCDMNAIRDISKRHGLKVIEDAAHCIEGTRDGIRPGAASDAACYSFYATKNLTCGEGGALGTNDKDLADRVKLLKLHGMSKDAASRYTGKYQHWDMLQLGWKYNLDDIHSALLVRQLDRLDGYLERRKRICAMYDEGFNGVAGLRTPVSHGKSAHHLYTIWVDPMERDGILAMLQEKGVGVAVNYRAIHTLKFFRESFGFKPEDFPNATLIGNSTITLPLYPGLKDEEVNYVIDSVISAVRAAS